MRKIVLTFGLISGAIIIVGLMVSLAFLDRIGLERGMVLGYTMMVMAFLLVYFGIRTYRDTEGGGSITFGKAFQVGMLISLISCLCYVAAWEVIYYNFLPDFGDKYAEMMMEEARREGATPAELEVKRRETEEFKVMYRNPFMNVAFTFIEPLPVGLLVTLVCAGLLSRRRREERAVPVFGT